MDSMEQHMKKQTAWLRVCALLLALVLAVCLVPVVTLLPRVDEAIVNVETITLQLSEIDWPALSENLDALLTTGNESLSEINIDELNKAVQDLRTVIAPLVKLFGG